METREIIGAACMIAAASPFIVAFLAMAGAGFVKAFLEMIEGGDDE